MSASDALLPRGGVWAALALVVSAQALFVTYYVTQEQTFYFWDHAMYHSMARLLAAAFRESAGAGIAALRESMGANYPLLFALPSLVTFGLWGEGRLVFILTNFFAFFLAYEAAMAFLLRRVWGLPWGTCGLLTVLGCSALPPLWLPLLEGYPDHAAAACLAVAVGLTPVFLERHAPWGRWVGAAVLAGILLGLAALLRRHFAYGAVALGVTVAGTAALELWRAKPGTRVALAARLGAWGGLAGGAALGFLAAAAPDFLRNAVMVDYGALYLSYKKAALDFLVFAVAGFGILPLGAALAGFWRGLGIAALRRRCAFLLAFGGAWLAVWCAGPGQAGHHYLLHALPLILVAGLAGLWGACGGESASRVSGGGTLDATH